MPTYTQTITHIYIEVHTEIHCLRSIVCNFTGKKYTTHIEYCVPEVMEEGRLDIIAHIRRLTAAP